MRRAHQIAILSFAVMMLGIVPVKAQAPGPGNRRPPSALESGKLIEKNGKKYLWGGPDEASSFDITDCPLEISHLHYGMGREYRPALIHPEFVSAREADQWLKDDKRVLAVRIGGEIKAYPTDLLVRHAMVNDVVGGRPVLAAYCYLAELGAVYERTYRSRTFTFGCSGYTYFDPRYWEGKDAFVLWDRETESLWWPVAGNAVSGPMHGEPLRLLDSGLWSQTTWGELKSAHPEAMVLAPGQTMEPPAGWTRYAPEQLKEAKASAVLADSIAPHWGDNSSFGNPKP
ncbi:MAG: hypothetical protein A3F83_15730 [Candidatus Glassbacteria bacterium RIFCSPLOWO2_12_FULL_58_11]|uniref:DUF3179 domain-containing protein n=2 Tax=Candidatus Glassiibacteriota TaxID=1817805 RepID=A0A1F5YLU5_9BACT|nr:MAG: hypothetical protein A3F83_15730 [Candidatus Glassbacteria bacterium RIFCSPLOWO2_12_FULL_58_11]